MINFILSMVIGFIVVGVVSLVVIIGILIIDYLTRKMNIIALGYIIASLIVGVLIYLLRGIK